MATMAAESRPTLIASARLPRWCLPPGWPSAGTQPALADVRLAAGRIESVAPAVAPPAAGEAVWNLGGAPLLPGLVEAHSHIDKAFTLPRLGAVAPGLLAAIEAMVEDRNGWTPADVRARAGKSVQWAYDAGVFRLRTHCDWWEPAGVPLAWPVLREVAEAWAGRVAVERVSLIPLKLFERRDDAERLADVVAASGPGALLGGFVHSTQWGAAALRNLIECAESRGLDIDLHCDEELNADAAGLATTAALAREIGFSGRIVCSHTCALAAKPAAESLAILDAVARAPITLANLPTTNLLLQDAVTGRTPRQRGITLVKEARARGIPVLVGTDNVQDAFCAYGRFDPVESLGVAALTAQLPSLFDTWSDAICRADWLTRGGGGPRPFTAGAPADLVAFPHSEPLSWPVRAETRVVMRGGRLAGGATA